MLVHALDVGHLPGDRLLGGLHLPRQPGVLHLQVTHFVDVACQTIVEILQILLLLQPGVASRAERAAGSPAADRRRSTLGWRLNVARRR